MNEEAVKQLQYIRRNLDEERINAFNYSISIIEENAKLKAEIDRLNGKSEMYRDMADSFSNSNIKLKAEIEQLKSTISKMETTTEHEDDLK